MVRLDFHDDETTKYKFNIYNILISYEFCFVLFVFNVKTLLSARPLAPFHYLFIRYIFPLLFLRAYKFMFMNKKKQSEDFQTYSYSLTRAK